MSNKEPDDAAGVETKSGTGSQVPSHRFKVSSLYCSIETTERSPKVSISVTFGVVKNEIAFNSPQSLTGAWSSSSFSQQGVEPPRQL